MRDLLANPPTSLFTVRSHNSTEGLCRRPAFARPAPESSFYPQHVTNRTSCKRFKTQQLQISTRNTSAKSGNSSLLPVPRQSIGTLVEQNSAQVPRNQPHRKNQSVQNAAPGRPTRIEGSSSLELHSASRASISTPLPRYFRPNSNHMNKNSEMSRHTFLGVRYRFLGAITRCGSVITPRTTASSNGGELGCQTRSASRARERGTGKNGDGELPAKLSLRKRPTEEARQASRVPDAR